MTTYKYRVPTRNIADNNVSGLRDSGIPNVYATVVYNDDGTKEYIVHYDTP